MPGRMEGNIDSIAGQRFPVADRLYRHVAKALLEERRSLLMANVDLGAEAGVIACAWVISARRTGLHGSM